MDIHGGGLLLLRTAVSLMGKDVPHHTDEITEHGNRGSDCLCADMEPVCRRLSYNAPYCALYAFYLCMPLRCAEAELLKIRDFKMTWLARCGI